MVVGLIRFLHATTTPNERTNHRTKEQTKTNGAYTSSSSRRDASGRITSFAETLDGARRKRARGRDAEDASDSDVPPPLSARLGLDRGVAMATTDVAVATKNGNAGRAVGSRGREKTVDDERLTTTTATTDVDKKTRDAKAKSKSIVDWLKSCEVTYERVLLMRSLDVDDALERAREVGVRSSRADFIKCLEEHGVAFSQTKKRRRANQAAVHAVETT